MLIEVTVDEFEVLWKLDYMQELERDGVLVIRENGEKLLLEINDTQRFLRYCSGTPESNIEKELIHAVQRYKI